MKKMWISRRLGWQITADLRKLRLAFLVFAALNSVTVAAMLFGNAGIQTAIVGSAAAFILVSYWIFGFQKRFVWPLDILEAALLLIIGIAVGEAERALGMFYVGNFFRSLYDSPKRATARSLMFYGALVVGLYSTPSTLELSDRVVPHFIGFIFTGLVMQLVSKTVTRHEGAVHRERTLRVLSEDLANTADDLQAYDVVVAALLSLGSEDPTLRGSVSIGSRDEMTVVAVGGDQTDGVLGGSVSPELLPAQVLDELLAGRSVIRNVDVRDAAFRADADFAMKANQAIVPLRSGIVLRGVAVYASDNPVPDELATVLRTLGSQVSTWLARREATEEAHRSEERYRALVQNSTDIVALVDATATVKYVSPSVTSVLGYAPDAHLGESGFLNVHPDDQDFVQTTFLSCVTHGTRPLIEVRVFDEARQERWLEVRLTNHLETEPLRSIVVNARDITERKNAERLRAELLRHLVVAQEDERKLIAGDIHDDSIQQITAAAIRLGMLRSYVTDPKGLDVLDKVETTITTSIQRLRKLMFSLRPPALDSEGLAAALSDHLAMTADECGFRGDLCSSIAAEPATEVAVTAFRIAQEALANVRKHANARRVNVELSDYDGGILVRVKDDGAGFAVDAMERAARGHLGMTSMRERAELAGGWFKISSSPGEGTLVEFLVRGSSATEPEVAA